MIEQIAYLALLGAPEIADGVASMAGSMVEGVGRRLAAGMYDEISANLTRDAGFFGGALVGAIGGKMSGMADDLQATAGKVLSGALQGEGVALVSAEELKFLRQLAADAADGRDIKPVRAEIRDFYRKQSAKSQG